VQAHATRRWDGKLKSGKKIPPVIDDSYRLTGGPGPWVRGRHLGWARGTAHELEKAGGIQQHQKAEPETPGKSAGKANGPGARREILFTLAQSR